MKYFFALAALSLAPAHAAELRPYTQIGGATVHLADLFTDLQNTPDRELGPSPAPGARIIVDAPQLAAIARDFAVDWRPQTGAEQAVLERRGVTLSRAAVLAKLRAALTAAGAPQDADFAEPDFDPPLLPEGVTPEIDVRDASYEAGTGRFSALVAVTAGDLAEQRFRLSGVAVPMLQGAVLTRRLAPGASIGPGDVVAARVVAARLHGIAPLLAPQAIGLEIRHDIPPGQPLTLADLRRPEVVARGAAVKMSLDAAGITLTAQGVAVEAGGVGDQIHVLNPVSHISVAALVVGPGEVRVLADDSAIRLAVAP